MKGVVGIDGDGMALFLWSAHSGEVWEQLIAGVPVQLEMEKAFSR